MLELAVIFSGWVSNLITSYVKPSKIGLLSEEDLAARKTFIRLINLIIGAVMLVLSAWLMGEPLDASSLSTSLESIFTILITFAFSQGSYFITKK